MKKNSKKMLALFIGALTLHSSIAAVSASAAESFTSETESEISYFEDSDVILSKLEPFGQITLKKGEIAGIRPANILMTEPLYYLPDDVEKGPYAIVVVKKKLKRGDLRDDLRIKLNTEPLDDGSSSTPHELMNIWFAKIEEALKKGPVLFCKDLTKENAEVLDYLVNTQYETVVINASTYKNTVNVAVTNDKDAYIIKYGESVELGVSASGGAGGYAYQWFRNGTAINGATSPTYTAAEVGKYTCRATDKLGTKGTSKAVNVVSTLSFTKLPDDVYIAEGGSGEMSVEISGGLAPYTYQWYKDGAAVGNSNSATYTVTSAGKYNCKVTDSLGQEITGRYGTVYIAEDLVLTTDLSDKEIMPASGVVLRVAAKGGHGTYSYQWYKDGAAVSGATNQSCGITAAGSYYCIVKDNSGQSVKSRTCQVIAKLAVTSQPQSKTVANGKTAALSVSVSGGKTPYTYQWYRNGLFVSGANSSTYNAASSGNYYCLIKDSSGQSITTNTVVVTVANAITISSQTQNYPVLSTSGTASLSVTASGGYGTLSYQWYKGNGTAISGATSRTYSATAAGTYYCKITDELGQYKYSSNIIVVNKLSISSQSGNVTINSGNSTTLSVSMTGGYGTLRYQWYKSNGTAISGATSRTYTTGVAGTYYCKITDGSNQTVYSSNKTVTVITYRITSQPKSGVIASDMGYKLSVGVTGGKAPYKYTWRKDGVYIGNTATLTVYDAGLYYCTIVDADGKTLTSDTVTLTKYYLRFKNTFPTYANREGSYYHLSAEAAGGSGKYNYYWLKLAAGSSEWVYTDCYDPELYVYAASAKGDRYMCLVTCGYSSDPGYAYLWGPAIYMADPMKLTNSSSYGSSTGTLTVKGSEGFGPYTVKWYKTTKEHEYLTGTLVSSYSVNSISALNYTVYKSKTTSGTYKEEYYTGYYGGWKTRTIDNCDVYKCEITDATGTKVTSDKFYVYRSNFN